MLERTQETIERLRRKPQAHSSSGRKRERATPPNVIGKGPLLSDPGIDLGVVVMLKDEAPYLEEWLAYHRALGVKHFYLYDNGSTDALHRVIEPWVNHGMVTLVHWPLPGGQIDAYSHAVRLYGPSTEWLGFFDVDEFVVPLADPDIPTLLARWPDAADVRVPRVDFGFSGHRQPPDALTIEAFTGVANVFGRDPAKPPRVKTIARSRSVSAVGIHTATVPDEPRDARNKKVPAQTIGKACWDLVQLNHYYTRSFEEFEAKRFRGSGTGRIARPAIPFDLPTERTDTSAQRFVERTQAVIDYMRTLAPSPYRYGSASPFEGWPRFNDLGLFTEFAIANTVLEEPEPVREPRLRLENKYRDIGFVGVISGHDHVVTDGELSGSTHLRPLLERCRGELVGTLVEAGFADGTVRFPVGAAGRRRVYATGFVVSTTEPSLLTTQLVRPDGSSSEPITLRLAEGQTWAGIVELDPDPHLAERVEVGISSETGELDVHDVFVISYG